MSTKIPPLPAPDSHHLKAAEGWLELGDHLEANEELEKIDAKWQVHPQVLEIRWRVYSKAENWTACEHIARAITKLSPGEPQGWLHLAYSLSRVKGCGLQSAFDVLTPIAHEFPTIAIIPYTLARYAAQLGKLREAERWWDKALAIAMKTGLEKEIRLMALDDPDLEPLWKEIKKT